ncbi:MAG: hypothetical protein ABH834_06720 [Candidatus Altiarchaeota archaeon]
MDKVFLTFVSFIVLAGLGIYFFGPEPTIPEMEVATTTITVTSTSTVSAVMQPQPSVTSTSLAQTSSTTTTIPLFAELQVDNVGKCLKTQLGKMNTVLATLNGSVFTGDWGQGAVPRIYYSCDGDDWVVFDQIMFKGGANIAAGASVNNSYRLGAKCGRNQPVDDLLDCEGVIILLETDSIIGSGAEASTSTLGENPYLDKFKGLGYHKVDLRIKWICPTCVPAVNKMIIEEPGVKSRSIGYGQEVNYVVYDPEVVKVERILYLANAGGTATILRNTEF